MPSGDRHAQGFETAVKRKIGFVYRGTFMVSGVGSWELHADHG
jgi:hypothetical protein